NKAKQLMQGDSDGLICLLGIVAELRKTLMLAKAGKLDPPQNNMLALFEDAQTLLICNFEDAAWKENEHGEDSGFFGSQITKDSPIENKAQAIIDSIRFNYW
ncbi:MAG: hypothetical protein Q4G59_06040, partial [Planctomycetia bacterium]|nr:hypothetical protein [Planctomycetia bacterium]